MVAGVMWVESEFDGEDATCGPCALAMAESWADQKYRGVAAPGQTATTQVYKRMRAAGRCDPNGASTGGGLNAQAKADGFKTWRQFGGDWLGFLKARLAEPAVVVTELAAAHNLRDSITGAGMDAGPGLAYHYICVCDYHPGGFSVRAGRVLPEGFFAADGDSDATNPIVGGHRTRVRAGRSLQFYPVPVLASARPCDLVAVYPRVKLPVLPTPQPPAPQITEPAGLAGWKDDGATLTAPNGVRTVLGFRDYVLAKGRAGQWVGGYPYDPEWHGGGMSVQAFAATLLLWRPEWGVVREGTIADALAILAHEHEGKAA